MFKKLFIAMLFIFSFGSSYAGSVSANFTVSVTFIPTFSVEVKSVNVDPVTKQLVATFSVLTSYTSFVLAGVGVTVEKPGRYELLIPLGDASHAGKENVVLIVF